LFNPSCPNRKGVPELRVVIWNAHWETFGGGEVYAGFLADVLVEQKYQVLLVGTCKNPIQELRNRLGLTLSNVMYERIPGERFLDGLVNEKDIFINGSFGSGVTSPSDSSIYICHFPTRSRKNKFISNNLLQKYCVAYQENGRILHPINQRVLLIGTGYLKSTQSHHLRIRCEFGVVQVLTKDVSSILLSQGDVIDVVVEGNLKIDSIGPLESVVTIKGLPNISLLKRFILGRGTHDIDFLRSYSQIWTNSNFTKHHVSKTWQSNSVVVYPPHLNRHRESLSRDPYAILSIGRFMDRRTGHSKNQVELIRAFQKLIKSSSEPWTLHLAGGVDQKNTEYFEKVKDIASRNGDRILFYPNCPEAELENLLHSSTFYWHATGMKIPAWKPEKMEHFGISILEAINAGLVPLVFDSAGPAEILRDFPELRFKTVSDLVKKTLKLSNSNLDLIKEPLEKRGLEFDAAHFSNNVRDQIKKITNY
jgi:glycosyltransferase involved in cell wall biosynthesis